MNLQERVIEIVKPIDTILDIPVKTTVLWDRSRLNNTIVSVHFNVQFKSVPQLGIPDNAIFTQIISADDLERWGDSAAGLIQSILEVSVSDLIDEFASDEEI